MKVKEPRFVARSEEDEDDDTTPVEFDEKTKDAENDPFLIADSYVTRGVCKALVCCVGEHSSRGIKDRPLNLEEQDTELKRRLSNIGGSLKYFALLCSIIILATAIIVTIINKAAVGAAYGGSEFVDRIVNCFIVALIMLIVAVPEGLDMTMDVSLAYSVLQMSKDDNVLVRDLESVEKVGQITDLVLGKTGTMTTEEMEVHSFFAQDDFKLNSRLNTFQNCELSRDIQEKIIQSIVWNSSAYIEMSENSFYVPEGQGTEVSLIKWLQCAEEPVHEYMKEKHSGIVRATVPFSSSLKRSIIAVELPQSFGHDTVRVFVKGAPEVVIEKCSRHYTGAGDSPTKETMEDQHKRKVFGEIKSNMTSKGMRCIALSYADMTVAEFDEVLNSMNGEIDDDDEIARLEGQDQTFLAVVALKDPTRTNIKEVVKTASESRINLFLVSGDDLLTSSAVATDVGIIGQDEFNAIKSGDAYGLAYTGRQFAQLVGDVQEETQVGEEGGEPITTYSLTNQAEFARIIGQLKIIGRADPETKRRLVAGLKGMNAGEEDDTKFRRVAVIGEGITDVKAFQAADVSFALQSGTSLARNNASMILRTDDFDSAMRAVMWGRNIFMNIQRFLQFQITCNLSVLIVVMVSYCVRQETVLNPVQLIYINLIMDILGALALASTRPTEEIKTYLAGQGNIMTPFMYRQILGCTLGMVGIMMVIMCADGKIFDLVYKNYDSTIETPNKMCGLTLIFNTFIFLQIFNMINCRDISATKKHGFAGLHRNFLTWIILLVLIAVQFAACFTFLGVPIFETSLNYYVSIKVLDEKVVTGVEGEEKGRYFAITVVSAAAILLINALLKLIPQRWISKMPQLDENRAIGSDSKLVSMYDRSAKKTVNTGGSKAAATNDIDEEESTGAAAGAYQDDEDGYDRQL